MIEYRITFGQRYRTEEHPVFKAAHPDGWLAVMAPDEMTARRVAIAAITNDWAFIYPPGESYPDLEAFPLGELGRIWVLPEQTEPAPEQSDVVRFLKHKISEDVAWAVKLRHHFDCPIPHCAENHTEVDECFSCECTCGVRELSSRMLAETDLKGRLVHWAEVLRYRDRTTSQTASARAETAALENVLQMVADYYSGARALDALTK